MHTYFYTLFPYRFWYSVSEIVRRILFWIIEFVLNEVQLLKNTSYTVLCVAWIIDMQHFLEHFWYNVYTEWAKSRYTVYYILHTYFFFFFYKEEESPTSLCGVIYVVLIVLQKKWFIFVCNFEEKENCNERNSVETSLVNVLLLIAFSTLRGLKDGTQIYAEQFVVFMSLSRST